MGGAPGPMDHPFHLPQVKTGKDLKDIFYAAAEEVQHSGAAVKLDGVNASFKLVDGPNGKEFAVDRGSLKPIDIQGITINNVSQRGFAPGMAANVTTLLSILNEALPSVQNELREIGMLDNPTLFLNTEFAEQREGGKTNVVAYEKPFIAIHGLNQFYEKTPVRGGDTRPGAKKDPGVPTSTKSYELRSSANDSAIIDLVDKLKPFAERYGYEVYGTVPSRAISAPDFTNTLNSNFTVHLGRDPESGEVVSRTQTLDQWLIEANNPGKDKVVLANGKSIEALSKLIYGSILEGAVISDLLAEGESWWLEMCSAEPNCKLDNDIKKAIDGAIIYHATRVLGNDILDVLQTDAMGIQDQSVTEHEGVVLRNAAVFGPKPVKITGEFLWKGWKESAFRAQNEALEPGGERIDDRGCRRRFAVVPGAFKPPHKGHYAMVKKYVEEDLGPEDIVVVYISPINASEREGFNPETQADISPLQSKLIWDIYKQSLPNPERIEILITPEGTKTPVAAAYDFVGPKNPFGLEGGDCVFMGTSTKGGDENRFSYDLQKFADGWREEKAAAQNIQPEQISVRSLPVSPLGDLSATQFREAVKLGDIKTISNVFLPTEGISPEEEAVIYDILGIETQPNQALQELLVQMINEAVGQARDLEGQTILLVGDSQMAGPMGRSLEKSLESRGAKVRRTAKVGAGAHWWNNKGFGENKEAFDNQKYDRVIVSMGGNDHWVPGTHKTKRAQENWRNNHLKRFMERLQSVSPDVQFFGPPEVRGQATGEKPGRDWANNAYKNTADELGITYYDMSKMVSNNPEFEEHNWSGDGVHFSPEGGKVFSDIVLSKLGGGTTPTTDTKPKPKSVDIPTLSRRERNLYLSKTTGVDPRMIHAIEQIESGGKSNVIAFNPRIAANIIRKSGDPEKIKQLEQVASKNNWRLNKYNNYKAVLGSHKAGYGRPWASFDAVYAIDPKAALRATAMGNYQVLGGKLLKLHDGDPDKALEAFKSDPATTSVKMFQQWTSDAGSGWKRAANSGDIAGVARKYNNTEKYRNRLGGSWDRTLNKDIYGDDWESEVAKIDAGAPVDFGGPGIESVGGQDWKKGRFVHGLNRQDYPDFDFDEFYKELDTHFADKGGSAGILSGWGKDYKFGNEHLKAYEELQKAKAAKPPADLVALAPEPEVNQEPPPPQLAASWEDAKKQDKIRQAAAALQIKPEPPAPVPPEETTIVSESEFQRRMKANLHGEMKWLLDNGPQDPGSAFPAKRNSGKSNAFLAKEEKEELDEISSMGGGNVEGAPGAGGGPWQHMDVEKENEKQKRNSKIPHGTPLVEEDELVEEVLNYLLRKIGE